MTEQELSVIIDFARGIKSLRAQAIAIHRKYLSILGARGTPAMKFMAEVDHPVPDLVLRQVYREQLLNNLDRVG